MRLALMLESDGLGGAEVVLLHLAEELRRRGHEVLPIGPEHGVGWLGARLRERGFEPESFRLDRWLDRRCIQHLVALLRRHEVDVFHGHEFDAATYGVIAARLARCPSVVTMHGNATMTNSVRRRMVLKGTLRLCDRVVAVSRATKQDLDARLRLASRTVSVVPNGIPQPRGSAEPVRRELGLREGELLLLAVGSLVPRKGHLVLFRALQALREQGLEAPWRLVVAGGEGGEERRRLETFLADHGLRERVHILTHRSDVPDLQAAADVFVMPSLWEGLPLAVLEAMLAGTPVVASSTSGIPEAIVSEREGLLVPPGDVDALADALRRLIVDPALRESLARRARERAEREFTVEAMATAYERIFEGVRRGTAFGRKEGARSGAGIAS